MTDLNKLKYEMVSNVYLYIQTKQDMYKDASIKNLDALYKAYHVSKKKVKPIELNSALTQFIKNKSGIAKYINLIYYSL